MMNSYSFYRFAISILYPNRCALCGEIIEHRKYFCPVCQPPLPPAEPSGVIACCQYNDDTKPMILNAKSQGNGYAISACGKLLFDTLCEYNIFPEIDIITYIPTRKSRLKEKGYCFPRQMAKDIAGLSGKKSARLLNVREYETSQKNLNQQERAENLKGKFYPAKEKTAGLRILLLDDVSTTGSTLREAARVLTDEGAKLVIPAAFAKTRITHDKTAFTKTLP